MSDEPQCPVSHESRQVWLKQNPNKASPHQEGATAIEASTVAMEEADHGAHGQTIEQSIIDPAETARWTWKSLFWAQRPTLELEAAQPSLGTEREISSIPRTNSSSNWVYPSERQFYSAMQRKNWDPQAEDMSTVVPLHNLVNEVAWKYVLDWEKGQPIKLTNFKGDASKLTPRAIINHYIFGKDLPFDRHDWTIDRDGVEVEYVIDFYTNKIQEGQTQPTFYMDVRPKLNSWAAIKTRFGRPFGF